MTAYKGTPEEFKALIKESGEVVKSEAAALDPNNAEAVLTHVTQIMDLAQRLLVLFALFDAQGRAIILDCAKCEQREGCSNWLEAEGVTVLEVPVRVQ